MLHTVSYRCCRRLARLITSVCLSGVHRDAEEAAVVMETAGSEVAPPLPAEDRDGQRRLPERVSAISIVYCIYY